MARKTWNLTGLAKQYRERDSAGAARRRLGRMSGPSTLSGPRLVPLAPDPSPPRAPTFLRY